MPNHVDLWCKYVGIMSTVCSQTNLLVFIDIVSLSFQYTPVSVLFFSSLCLPAMKCVQFILLLGYSTVWAKSDLWVQKLFHCLLCAYCSFACMSEEALARYSENWMADPACVPDGLGGQLRQTLWGNSQLAQSIKSECGWKLREPGHPLVTYEHSSAVSELMLQNT